MPDPLIPYSIAAGHPLALGRRPRVIGPGAEELILEPLRLAEVVALVEMDGWPELVSPRSPDPRGLALYPPSTGAPVVVELDPRLRDAYGTPIHQVRAAVCAVWREGGRAVIRCSVPGDRTHPAIHPLDVRPSDLRAVILVLTGPPGRRVPVPEPLSGWTIGRADPPADTLITPSGAPFPSA